MAFDPDNLEVHEGVPRSWKPIPEGHVARIGDRSDNDRDPLSGSGGFIGRIPAGSDSDILDHLVPIDEDGVKES